MAVERESGWLSTLVVVSDGVCSRGDPDRLKFFLRLVAFVREPPRAAVPVPGVAGVALELVQDGVKPVAERLTLVGLRDRVGLVPAAGDRVVESLAERAAAHFTSSLNAFRTFSIFGSATALQ